MKGGRKEFIFLWFIENYSHNWHKNGEELTSPPFTADGLEGTAWNLRLYPRGVFQTVNDHITLFLRRGLSDDGPQSVSIKFEVSFLAADGSPLFAKERDGALKKGDLRGWFAFLKMDEILLRRRTDYLPQDVLTVRCKLWKGDGNVVRNIGQCSARTRIGIENISFMHEVENFSSLKPNQMHTIEVRSHPMEECFATSSLYFTDDPWREGETMVEITPSDSSYVLAKRKVSLLGSEAAIVCGEDDNLQDVERKDISDLPLSLTRKEILNKKGKYLPEDKLTLLCECVFSTGLEFEKIEEIQQGARSSTTP